METFDPPQDEINDSYSDRTEERRGTSVKGSYSYSNGHTRTNGILISFSLLGFV